MTKNEIRREIRKKRRELGRAELIAGSSAAETALTSLAEFKTAAVVCVYVPLPGEMDTRQIIEKSWSIKKEVCVPAFKGKEDGYGLARFCRETQMAESRFGVMEPVRKDWVDISGVDFIVVPGLAFDTSCGRVGHGGGFYDRILAGNTASFKAGLGFDWQVLDLVPMDKTDVRLDAVVTDKRVIRLAAPGVARGVVAAGGRRR